MTDPNHNQAQVTHSAEQWEIIPTREPAGVEGPALMRIKIAEGWIYKIHGQQGIAFVADPATWHDLFNTLNVIADRIDGLQDSLNTMNGWG